MKCCGPILLAGLIFGAAAGLRAASGNEVGMIGIKGAIGPATASYISRAIDVAARRNDACLIIQLDTPGGLMDSTESIVQKFRSSPVPVVVYVAPGLARAASAGCFITMAADVAAMAPHTTSAPPIPSAWRARATPTASCGRKMENDAAMSIRNIAENRGRNADWAESSVRRSVAITAEKALELKVIDLIATDVPDLLKQLDGREVHGRILKTAGATVTEIPMAFSEKLLQLLRPEVMFILMLVAIYGIIGELSNPGRRCCRAWWARLR